MIKNRDKGHNFERKLVTLLKDKFPKAVSSRQESRAMDALGIDIVNTEDFGIQCKSECKKTVKYIELLERVKKTKKHPIVAHQYTEKKGNRFYTKGEYVIMELSTFIDLLNNKT
ncbi:MAG TPA: hypothetical protein PKD00_00765 [Burkholderiales bacterium]|nr:hypothetical protein [Burkholderiales bacterium]